MLSYYCRLPIESGHVTLRVPTCDNTHGVSPTRKLTWASMSRDVIGTCYVGRIHSLPTCLIPASDSTDIVWPKAPTLNHSVILYLAQGSEANTNYLPETNGNDCTSFGASSSCVQYSSEVNAKLHKYVPVALSPIPPPHSSDYIYFLTPAQKKKMMKEKKCMGVISGISALGKWKYNLLLCVT